MLSLSTNTIDFQPSKYFPSVFKSFQQCNHALYEIDNLNLDQYLEITRQVQFEIKLIKDIPESHRKMLTAVVTVFLEYSKNGIQDCCIPLSALEIVGFDISANKSHMPNWFQHITDNLDDNTKRERRFLKRYNMKIDVDFVMETNEIDGDIIMLGHYITRLALYKLVMMRYGPIFMEAVVFRVFNILYFYDDYKRVNEAHGKITLSNTINKLKDDIDQLKTGSNILTFDNSPPVNYFADDNWDIRSSERISELSHLDSDTIMKNPEYSDELNNIHQLIESNINNVDIRISQLHTELSVITSKIDDIVSSIAMTQRYSKISLESSSSDDSYSSRRQTKSFIQFMGTPPTPTELRNTCMGNEHQL